MSGSLKLKLWLEAFVPALPEGPRRQGTLFTATQWCFLTSMYVTQAAILEKAAKFVDGPGKSTNTLYSRSRYRSRTAGANCLLKLGVPKKPEGVHWPGRICGSIFPLHGCS